MSSIVIFGSLLLIAWLIGSHFKRKWQISAKNNKILAIFRSHGVTAAVGEWVKVSEATWSAIEHDIRALEPQPPPPFSVSESISVLLRRQIPVRDDGTPRSWLGGLPSMPHDVDWPYGPDNEYLNPRIVPLHFVAQICLADLPTELWGGLGPRHGWLLLFVNYGNGFENEDRQPWRVIHTTELGSKRHPPEGIPQLNMPPWIHSGVQSLTNRFPEWPLDMVTVDNEFGGLAERRAADPDYLEKVLYPKATPWVGERPTPRLGAFSWRALLATVHHVIHDLEYKIDTAKRQSTEPSAIREMFAATFDYDALKEYHKLIENWYRDSASQHDVAHDLKNMHLKHLDEITKKHNFIINLLNKYPKTEMLLEQYDAEAARYTRWLETTHALLQNWYSEHANGDLDRPLSAGGRNEFSRLSDETAITSWRLLSANEADLRPRPIGITTFTQSIAELVKFRLDYEALALAPSYYVDANLRKLLPEADIPALEAIWRKEPEDYPHRIGGYYDGVQSEPDEGPQSEVLLLQLGTDRAMGFTWWDCGAIYVFISAEALKRGDLTAARVIIEGH